MSAKHTDNLDAEILAAFEALDSTIPAGYFDEFESRLSARLEAQGMAEMTDENTSGASARDEDSGLHDIRELAASTKLRIDQVRSAQEAAEESFLASASAALKAVALPEPGKDYQSFATDKAAPVVANDERDEGAGGLPVWIYAAVGAVAAAAVIFFVVRGGAKGNKAEVAQTAAPAAIDPSGAIGSADKTPGGLGSDGHDTELEPNAPGTAALAAAGDADEQADPAVSAPADDTADADKPGAARVARASKKRAKGARSSSGKAGKNARKDESRPEAIKAAPKKKKKPTKAGEHSIDDLLKEASGGKNQPAGGGKPKPADKPKPTRTRVESSDVRKAMNAINGKFRKCYDKYQEVGTVTVKFSVAPSGKITSAKTTGKFAGSNTGRCVAAAVKTAKLPEFDGKPMSFTWPVLLTQ